MSKAAKSIVSGYVLLKNRKALEDLLAHRQHLLDGLKRVCGIDPKQVVDQIRQEIAVIEAGLERLDGKAGRAQDDDRVAVLRLTVSDGAPPIDDRASTRGAAAEAARTDQLEQVPARKVDVKSPAAQAAPAGEQDNTQIRVLGLAVSVASPAAAMPPGSAPQRAVGGLDPGDFALCAGSSNEPMLQIDEESKETETPYPAIDAFRLLVSVWSDEPTKP